MKHASNTPPAELKEKGLRFDWWNRSARMELNNSTDDFQARLTIHGAAYALCAAYAPHLIESLPEIGGEQEAAAARKIGHEAWQWGLAYHMPTVHKQPA